MSFIGLLRNRVTIVRPSVTYTKGVPSKTYSSVDSNVRCSIQYVGAVVEGFGSQQPTQHGYETSEGWWGAFIFGTDIQMDDRITDDLGRVFIVKSVPLDVAGREHHIECNLALQDE